MIINKVRGNLILKIYKNIFLINTSNRLLKRTKLKFQSINVENLYT